MCPEPGPADPKRAGPEEANSGDAENGVSPAAA